MKIVLIGAGYVGGALLASLHQEGHEIVVTTTQEIKIPLLSSHANQVILLPQQQKKLQEVLACVDAVIVLVAPLAHCTYEKTYLDTAKMVVTHAKKSYLLYTSSTSVYEGAQGWVTEETPVQPISEKGKILIDTEHVYLSRSPTCVLRLGGIYGPGRELEKRAQHFSGQTMSGNGQEFTNHIHLEECREALLFCLHAQLEGIYNLVNEAHPTRQALYEGLCTKLGIALPNWQETVSLSSYKVSNEKIRKRGFNPFATLA